MAPNHPIVYHSGSTPSDIMIVGEKPGRVEANTGYPFSGPSGEILAMVLAHCGDNYPYHKSSIYITNLDKTYDEGNPNPTYDSILEWGEVLRNEVLACRPKVIICAGRFSSWWFLGGWDKWGMRSIHGRVCRGGELFDSSQLLYYPDSPNNLDDIDAIEALRQDYISRANGAYIVSCFHPANALPSRDPKGDMMGVVWRDFDTAIRCYESLDVSRHKLSDGRVAVLSNAVSTPVDHYDGCEIYEDATGQQVADYINTITSSTNILAIDTEDTANPTTPWTIQVCSEPGYALTMRCDRPDAQVGYDAIQWAIDNNFLVVMHFLMHDLPVLRKLGINTSRINRADTSYNLYILGEPQSLKVAAWRWCGMFMDELSDVVGNVARAAQISYLLKVVVQQYPKPGKLQYRESNGELKDYSPHSPSKKAENIIKSVNAGKQVDVYNRWHDVAGSGHKAKIIRDIYKPIVDELGPMPPWYSGLKDVDRTRAVRYECRDPDATLRVYYATLVRLQEMGLA